MLSVQEWLDRNYPNKNQVEEINLSDFKYLRFDQPSGLIINGYPNLKKIKGEYFSNITKLTISNCLQLEEVNINNSKNTQNLILNNLPSLKKLKHREGKLTNLSLIGCPRLETISCSRNKLTSLDLTNCSNLQLIYCSDNLLTEIKLPRGEKLKILNLSNNNFFEQDLSFLKHLINLNRLYLENDSLWKISQETYNRFYGSLWFLKEMSKLENLDISDTDIDSGFEYLPDSLKRFECSVKYRKDAKCKVIYDLFTNEQGKVETEEYGNIKNFPQKFQEYKQKIEQWKKLNFTEEEVESWASIGLTLYEYEFADYLKKEKKLIPSKAKNNLDELKKEYNMFTTSSTLSSYVVNQIKNFNHKELTSDQQSLIDKLISNQDLKERYKQYGLCKECKKFNSWSDDYYIWCKSCNAKHFQEDFSNWTSGNPQIDEFIREYQLQAINCNEVLEWIPFDKIHDMKYLTAGGFSKVYKARWIYGQIENWNIEDRKWKRKKHSWVALKSLNNSQNMTANFLKEINFYKLFNNCEFNDYIVPCYGISQDPEVGNYLMVMKYISGGDLRQYLQNNFSKLNFENKLEHLSNIAEGLKNIHNEELIHRDFHAGNILSDYDSYYIADLGLCRPVDENNQKKVFGVLPYVAPEVLFSQPYIQASDIYSFGIVAYEVLSGLPPYYDRTHDISLAIKICQGLRPQFKIKVPRLLEDLIKRCWNIDPQKRPTANNLEKTLRKWQEEINNGYGNTEFKNQLQEAEEFNKTLTDEVKYPDYKKKLHKGASYHSKLLPTKEITQLLINNQLQATTIELNTHLMKTQQLAKEIKEIIDLENLTKNKQKKYDDLKKALKFVIEKSDELEQIIADNQLNISEDAEKWLVEVKELKTKAIELQKEDNTYQKLEEKKIQKEKELEELKNNFLKKINNYSKEKLQEKLTKLLSFQKDIIKHNASSAVNGKEEIIKKLVDKTLITKEELNNFCQKQAEITQLEIRLEEITKHEEKQLTQIIIGFTAGDNNIFSGNISIDGNVINYQNTDYNNWININFTPQQTQEWINIGMKTEDFAFCAWLRDSRQLTPEKVLNNYNFAELKREFEQNQPQAQIIQQTNLPSFQNK